MRFKCTFSYWICRGSGMSSRTRRRKGVIALKCASLFSLFFFMGSLDALFERGIGKSVYILRG